MDHHAEMTAEMTAEELDDAIINYAEEHGTTNHNACIELIHRGLPEARSVEFHNLLIDSKTVRIEIPQIKAILIRDVSVPTIPKIRLCDLRLCDQCAMRHLLCASAGSSHPDNKMREMPCEGDGIDRHPFKAYKMMDQTSRKQNGRKEYIPDTAESFDIKGTWNSVRTMIGMG